MPANIGWREAIAKVLESSGTSMHYSAITQAIIDKGYRKTVGATPAATVAATLSMSLKQDGDSSPFVRTATGFYALRTKALGNGVYSEPGDAVLDPIEAPDQEGLINAFGMFWSRENVYWAKGKPRVLGVQQSGSNPVDFAGQAGVYLLYDGNRVIYVGRVTEPLASGRVYGNTLGID